MVAPGGCAWLLGGRAWLLPGACMVAPGGVMHGCSGGACVVFRGGVHGFFDEIRSMSGRYASYWNAFLFCQCAVIFASHYQNNNVLILQLNCRLEI